MAGIQSLTKIGSLAAVVALSTTTGLCAAELLALRDVAVVDTRSGEITTGQTVMIRGDRIEDIVALGAEPAESHTVIEGAGRYVVPGYMDMHAHVLDETAHGDHDHSAGNHTTQATKLELLLVNGVTGFRQMSGSADMIAAARALNAATAAGEVVAPEVLQVPGDIYLGQAPAPDAARAFVRAQQAAGADFVKIVAGPREGALAVMDEARKLGLGVAGHLPVPVSTAEAVAAGFTAFEHLGATPGNMLDCAKAGAMIRAKMVENMPKGPMELPPTFLLNPMLYTAEKMAPALKGVLGTFDPEMCDTLAELFIEKDVWQVPTLIRIRGMNFGGAEAFRQDPNLKYLPAETRAVWEELGMQFDSGLPAETKSVVEAIYGLTQRITGQWHASGVKMLAGSDLGGIWVLPGFGLHREFIELEQAGLSPLSVLQATTLNAGEFLGRADELGVVAPGFRADLVLLDANPMEAAGNLAAISGVMTRGSFIDADGITEIKRRIAENAAD